MGLFDFAPYDFIRNHKETDLKPFLKFKHRTFNSTDLLYFIHFFKNYYSTHNSLEDVFIPTESGAPNVKSGIENFYNHFTSNEFFPSRTTKHVASPSKKSACKRINMFLRWMVRNDNAGVDFGIWKSLSPSQLSCPLDVHSGNVARKLGLIHRKQNDAKALLELDTNLRKLDPKDPVKYDFALFGLGVFEKF